MRPKKSLKHKYNSKHTVSVCRLANNSFQYAMTINGYSDDSTPMNLTTREEELEWRNQLQKGSLIDMYCPILKKWLLASISDVKANDQVTVHFTRFPKKFDVVTSRFHCFIAERGEVLSWRKPKKGQSNRHKKCEDEPTKANEKPTKVLGSNVKSISDRSKLSKPQAETQEDDNTRPKKTMKTQDITAEVRCCPRSVKSKRTNKCSSGASLDKKNGDSSSPLKNSMPQVSGMPYSSTGKLSMENSNTIVTQKASPGNVQAEKEGKIGPSNTLPNKLKTPGSQDSAQVKAMKQKAEVKTEATKNICFSDPEKPEEQAHKMKLKCSNGESRDTAEELSQEESNVNGAIQQLTSVELSTDAIGESTYTAEKPSEGEIKANKAKGKLSAVQSSTDAKAIQESEYTAEEPSHGEIKASEAMEELSTVESSPDAKAIGEAPGTVEKNSALESSTDGGAALVDGESIGKKEIVLDKLATGNPASEHRAEIVGEESKEEVIPAAEVDEKARVKVEIPENTELSGKKLKETPINPSALSEFSLDNFPDIIQEEKEEMIPQAKDDATNVVVQETDDIKQEVFPDSARVSIEEGTIAKAIEQPIPEKAEEAGSPPIKQSMQNVAAKRNTRKCSPSIPPSESIAARRGRRTLTRPKANYYGDYCVERVYRQRAASKPTKQATTSTPPPAPPADVIEISSDDDEEEKEEKSAGDANKGDDEDDEFFRSLPPESNSEEEEDESTDEFSEEEIPLARVSRKRNASSRTDTLSRVSTSSKRPKLATSESKLAAGEAEKISSQATYLEHAALDRPSNKKLVMWRQKLSVGARVEVRCNSCFRWFAGNVVRVSGSQMQVEYAKSVKAWYDVNSKYLQPAGSQPIEHPNDYRKTPKSLIV